MLKFRSTIILLAVVLALAASVSAQPEQTAENRRVAESVARIIFTPQHAVADEDKQVAGAIEAVAAGNAAGPGSGLVLRVYYDKSKVGARDQESIRSVIERLLPPLHRTHTLDLRSTAGIRPLGPPQMGTATAANVGCLVGTLGVVVTDSSNRKRYITCNHVAAVDRLSFCPNAAKAKEVGLLQYPSDCNAVVAIGRLLGPPPEIKDPPTYNDVDAALVEERGGGFDAINICGICPNGNWIAPDKAEKEELQIYACGAASGPSQITGKVEPLSAVVKLTYQPCGATAWFSGQIEVDGVFAIPGDSGAFAFDQDGAAVGLIFAGDGATVTFLNPAPNVLDALGGVKIIPCVK